MSSKSDGDEEKNVRVQCADDWICVTDSLIAYSTILAKMYDDTSVDDHLTIPLRASTVALLDEFLAGWSSADDSLDKMIELAVAADFLDVWEAQEYACNHIRELLQYGELPIDSSLLCGLPEMCVEEVARGMDRDSCAEMAKSHPAAFDHLAISRFRPGGLRVCKRCTSRMMEEIDTLVQGARQRCVASQIDKGLVYVDQDREWDAKVRERRDQDDQDSVSSIDLEEFCDRNDRLFVQEYGEELAERWHGQTIWTCNERLHGIFHAIITYAIAKEFHASWKRLPIGCPDCVACALAAAGVDVGAGMTEAIDKLCVAFAAEKGRVELLDDHYDNLMITWIGNAVDENICTD